MSFLDWTSFGKSAALCGTLMTPMYLLEFLGDRSRLTSISGVPFTRSSSWDRFYKAVSAVIYGKNFVLCGILVLLQYIHNCDTNSFLYYLDESLVQNLRMKIYPKRSFVKSIPG
jgi:hypothetical protein